MRNQSSDPARSNTPHQWLYLCPDRDLATLAPTRQFCALQSFKGSRLDDAHFVNKSLRILVICACSISFARSSFSTPSRVNTCTSITVPFTGRDTQGSVFHVRGFLTKDRAEQLLFWSELSLTLRSDLADQNVTRAHLCADVHNAGFVQLRQRPFADIGNVAGDFLWP